MFSFGVLLHELATGVRPFAGDSSPELMSAILRDVPAPLTERRPDLPQHLARIVRRCLEKSPADRYQTMREVERELRDLQKETASEPSRRLSTGVSAVRRQSFWIAVRPLKVPQHDASLQAFGDGLLEDLTAGLSRFPHLSVAARDAAQQTRYLLEGSIRKSGSIVRVSMQLVDAQSGTQMWAETYDRDLSSGDIFAVQDDVTDRVRRNRRGCLRCSRPIDDALDPRSSDRAPLFAGIAAACTGPTTRIPSLTSTHDCARPWRRPQRRSLTTPNSGRLSPGSTPTSTRTFSTRLRTRCRGRGGRRAGLSNSILQASTGGRRLRSCTSSTATGKPSLSTADRAMAINPRNTNTAAFLALLLGHMGETDRAFAIASRARTLNSHHPGWYHFVEFDRDYLAGDYESAYVAVKKINMPELVFPQLMLADVCGQLGRIEEGRAAIEAVYALAPAFADRKVYQEVGKRWFWTEELFGRFDEGFRKLLKSLADRAE